MHSALPAAATALLFGFLSPPCLAGDSSPSSVRVDRYTQLSTTASALQMMPLNTVISPSLEHARSIEQAIRSVLRGTGYRLYPAGSSSSEQMKRLFSREVPQVQQAFQSITVFEALHALAGPAFELLLDQVLRLVSFEINAAYLPENTGRDRSRPGSDGEYGNDA